MKRAIAIALMGLGLQLAGQAPAEAATITVSSTGGLMARPSDSMVTRVGGNACWWDEPIIGAGVAFFELLRDEEADRHCDGYQSDYAPRYYKEKREYHDHKKKRVDHELLK